MEAVISLSAFKSDASRLLGALQGGIGIPRTDPERQGPGRGGRLRRTPASPGGPAVPQAHGSGRTDIQRGKLTAQENVFSTVRDRLASNQVDNG